MPFALVFIGLLLIVVGFQNTYQEFGKTVSGDFTGPGNFIYWIIALGVIGALGYAKPLQGFSRVFMGLIILSMMLANKGFFAQFQNAVASGSKSPDTQIGAPLPAGGGAGASSGSSSSDTTDIIKTGAEIFAAFGGF